MVAKNKAWISPALWGVAAGAVATMVVGFAWGGWLTGGTAEKMAAAREEKAVVQAFLPLCVAEGKLHPDQHGALEAASYYRRGDFVEKAGWVTVTGRYRDDVASACAEALLKTT